MNTRKTSTKIIFNLIDETAKEDAAFDALHSPVRSWCDLDALKDGGYSGNYLTNEHNYSLLNGTIDEIDYIPPDVPTYAFVSNFSSNDSCTFDSEYYFRIIFDDFHTVPGITINFDGDFLPDKIRVVYYNSTANNHIVLNSKEFTVDENNFFCDSGGVVENFKEIRIYFLSTKYPNSLIKMSKIVYGVSYEWKDGENKKASIVNADVFQETDITSNTLSIGTCRFTLYSEDDDFNIDNPKNIYSAIKKNQKIEVYEIIKNYDDNYNLIGEPEEIFIGQYYVKEWNADVKHSITFNCVDLMGILDDIKFEDQIITSTYSFGMAIASIIDTLNMGDIIVFPSRLYELPLKGLMPLCTYREFLQAVCFATGTYATCNRRRKIYIYEPPTSISYNITDENNFGVISSKLNPVVTGVQYPIINYTRSANKEILCELEMNVGSNQTIIIPDKLVFWGVGADPSRSATSTAQFTITSNKCQYMLHKFVVNVTSAGKVVIEGYTYNVHKQLKIKKQDIPNVDDNIIDISNISIYMPSSNSYDDNSIPQWLLNYYGKRNSCEYEFRLNNETSGAWCIFKNMYNEDVKANIFNMSIDLTGGFIAKTKLAFCEDLSNLQSMYVCGNELLGGENSGNNIGII